MLLTGFIRPEQRSLLKIGIAHLPPPLIRGTPSDSAAGCRRSEGADAARAESVTRPTDKVFTARVSRRAFAFCTVDWFTAWPKDALLTVATSFLADINMSDDVRASILEMCGFFQESVSTLSGRYYGAHVDADIRMLSVRSFRFRSALGSPRPTRDQMSSSGVIM